MGAEGAALGAHGLPGAFGLTLLHVPPPARWSAACRPVHVPPGQSIEVVLRKGIDPPPPVTCTRKKRVNQRSARHAPPGIATPPGPVRLVKASAGRHAGARAYVKPSSNPPGHPLVRICGLRARCEQSPGGTRRIVGRSMGLAWSLAPARPRSASCPVCVCPRAPAPCAPGFTCRSPRPAAHLCAQP